MGAGLIRSWFSLLGVLLGCGSLWAQAVPPSETLLPRTTAGWLATTNYEQLREHWNKTQVGVLGADPVMEPFTKDFRRQMEHRWSRFHKRLGLTLDDLKELPSGELAVAMIRPAPGEAATAILADVTGHLSQANEKLAKATQHQLQQGAKKTQQQIGGLPVLIFELPPQEEDQPAAPASGAAPKPQLLADEPPEKVAYLLSGNLLVATDDLDVMVGIVARLREKRGDSLADVPGFQAVMRRCQADLGKGVPQVRWFVHPIGYADAARAATPEDRRRKGKTILEVLQNQGFEAMQGVGGFVDFSAEGFEWIHRTAAFAPPPYQKAMKMLVFPNAQDFTPPPWVPEEIATYTTFYADIRNAFDNFGPLFDELFAEPQFLFITEAKYQQVLEAGKFPPEMRKDFEELRVKLGKNLTVTTKMPGRVWVIHDQKENYVVRKVVQKRQASLRVYHELKDIWEEVKTGMLTQADGPQIDLREELIVHLGQRVTMLTDYQTPIMITSERLLFAIEATNEKAVAAAVEKLMKPDRSAKKRIEPSGQVIWEFVEEQPPDVPPVPVVSIPALNPAPQPNPQPQPEQRLLPHGAITVCHGQLFVASHIDFLRKVLKPGQKPLAQSREYLEVEKALAGFGFPQRCGRFFSLTDEEYRPTYELIKQNKMPRSETMLARLLNTLSPQAKQGQLRQPQLDGSKLPDYSVVRRSLGPAGLIVVSERDGWFLKGCTLTKK